jgi:hypothetical protein
LKGYEKKRTKDNRMLKRQWKKGIYGNFNWEDGKKKSAEPENKADSY